MVSLVKNIELMNPKRNLGRQGREGWYNYYAGYSHAFVEDVIFALDANSTSAVLDPWNGGGTTTLVAAQEGLKSVGIDLNPAMVVIAKAKLVKQDEIFCAIIKLKNLRVNTIKKQVNKDDYLLHWFDEETANYLRYVDSYICGKKNMRFDIKTEKINSISCITYLALFEVVRELIKAFIPSNPTWVKKAKDHTSKVSVPSKVIKNSLINKLKTLSLTTFENEQITGSEILCASSKNLPLSDNSIDFVITSPPYCTRIDYGIATSPELAILVGYDPKNMDKLRRNLTGRTTIDNVRLSEDGFGTIADDFLLRVKAHPSIASATYYYKNLVQYFLDLKLSISEIRRVTKKSGRFVCVVQDSHYKDVYCDLASVIIEMAQAFGFSLDSKSDFNANLNMANINSSAKKYRDKSPAIESVLIFK